MFDPYHPVWRLIWKNNFLKKISNEKVYITMGLKKKNLLDSYNEFSKYHGENFKTFEETFYAWAEMYFPEYFTEAIDTLKKDTANSDYFLSGISREMMKNVNLLFKKVKNMDGEFLILELLMNNLQISDVLEYYISLNQDEYKYIVDVIKKLYDKFSNITRLSNGGYIKCLIFCERYIKKNPVTVWEDFLKMLFLLEDKLGNILDILDPIKASIFRREKEDGDDKIKELIYSFDINMCNPVKLEKFRNQYDYADYFYKNGQPQFLEIRNTYILRNYQVELIKYAIRGQNSIIMAPTGSGKTLCAVEIIRSHILDNSSNGKGYRCLFIAPTGPLVLQQSQVLKTYLGDLYTVTILNKNSSEEDVLSQFLAHDVIVCTPQLFLNNLLNNDKSKQLYFSDLSLIIFDECHHCNASHPYKQIMNLFHGAIGDYQKPQIVGLTASIGTGKTITYEGCYNYYLEMAVNLHAKRICSVYKNRDSLIKVMKLPVDEIIEIDVDQSLLWKNFNDTIKHLVNNLLKVDPTNNLNEHLNDYPISDVTKPGYFSKISKLATFKAFVKDPEVFQWIDNCVKAFIHINLVKEVSQLLPISYVNIYCQDYLENIDSYMKPSVSRDVIYKHLTNMKDTITNVIGQSKNSFPQYTPIFEKLLVICREQIKSLPDSRIIIFVPTRFIAVTLCHSIESINKVKNLNMQPGYIIANGNTRMLKQSPAEQNKTLENFRKGNINIIIATTIAEEGLDIDECNLVIKYNIAGNEKTLIQRRGRARALNAKSILLTCNNNYTSQEVANLQKEKIMFEISETINCMSHSAFTKEVERKRAEMKSIADEKYKNEIERRKLLYGKVYDVCCKYCKKSLIKSSAIKQLDENYIVLDEKIFKKTIIDIEKVPNPGLNFSRLANSHCKNCYKNDISSAKIKIGEIIHIEDHFYFRIILKNISFLNVIDGDTYEERSRWDGVKNTLFLIPNVTIGELIDYNSNFEKRDNKTYVALMECKEELKFQNNHLRIWKKAEEKEIKNLERFME